jgi:hypothetical protein
MHIASFVTYSLNFFCVCKLIATCYLPADHDSDDDSDDDDESAAFRPLSEPHHLLTCTADQFSDIADIFIKSRSVS